jgi:hypothetical protein
MLSAVQCRDGQQAEASATIAKLVLAAGTVLGHMP